MRVECVYASEKDQYFIALTIHEDATIEEVIRASGVLEKYPELMIDAMTVGVFGQKRVITDWVRAGDRVEIYRPLIINPMDARRSRAPVFKKKRRKSWKIVVI